MRYPARQGERGGKLPANDASIKFETHKKHVQHDTELGRRVHRHQFSGWNDGVLHFGKESPQLRRAKGEARENLADNGRLVQSGKQAPEYLAEQDDCCERRQ